MLEYFGARPEERTGTLKQRVWGLGMEAIQTQGACK